MTFFAVLATLFSVGLATEEVAKIQYGLPYAVAHPYKVDYPFPPGVPFTLPIKTAEVVKTEPVTYATGYPYAAGHPYVTGYPYAAGYPFTAGYHPYAAPVTTVKVEAEPIEAVAPVATVAATPVSYAGAYVHPYAYAPYAQGSQFHAQDEYGNLNYGYTNINSAKQEVGNTYGGVTGGYSYVDAEGKLQHVNYVADAAGFRVADSRLPVAPVYDGVAPTFNPEPLVAPVFDGVAPAPVEDTPEVAEARAAHLAAVEAAKADRKKRSADADPAILSGYTSVVSAPTPFVHNAPVVRTYAGLPTTYYGAGYLGAGYLGAGYFGAGYLY